MNTNLYPSLDMIRDRLCGPPDHLVRQYLDDPGSLSSDLVEAIRADELGRYKIEREAESRKFEAENAAGASTTILKGPEPSAELLQRVQTLHARAVAGQRWHKVTDPEPGLIKVISELRVPDRVVDYYLPEPLIVALDRKVDAAVGLWTAWLVSPDIDYATPYDLVVAGSDDAQVDPSIATVQCWNLVTVWAGTCGTSIGKLTEEQLAAARVLSQEYRSARPTDFAVASEPGKLLERSLTIQDLRKSPRTVTVTTGTPLAESAEDLRTEYQLLYHAAAAPLTQCAMLALAAFAEPPSVWQRFANLIRSFLPGELPVSSTQPAFGDDDSRTLVGIARLPLREFLSDSLANIASDCVLELNIIKLEQKGRHRSMDPRFILSARLTGSPITAPYVVRVQFQTTSEKKSETTQSQLVGATAVTRFALAAKQIDDVSVKIIVAPQASDERA